MAYTPENNPYIPGDPYSYDLKWMVSEIKRALLLYDTLNGDFALLHADFDTLYNYVHNYFDNLDLTQEVSDKLDEMADNGQLAALIQPLFDAYTYQVDNKLTAMSQFIGWIDPDSFDGTDTQKLQQAFDEANGGGTIKISRRYELDSTITIVQVYSANYRTNVIGDTELAEIYVPNGVVGFAGTAGNTGGLIFRNVKLTGTSSSTLFTTGTGTPGNPGHTALVDVIFDNCILSGFQYLGNGNHYMQSLQIFNCVVRQIASVLRTQQNVWYNVLIQNCIIEGCGSLGSISYPEGVSISDNVIESNNNPIVVATYVSGSLSIKNNYFEANTLEDINLSNASDSNRPRNIIIEANYFYKGAGEYCIKLPNAARGAGNGDIRIVNNSVLGGGKLITGSNVVYDDVFCAFNAGSITDLASNYLRVLTAADFFSM